MLEQELQCLINFYFCADSLVVRMRAFQARDPGSNPGRRILMTSKKLKFNKYWFKPRRFGLGATPTTWEGWLVVFLFLLWVVYLVANTGPESSAYMPLMVIAIVLLIIVSKKKTKGQWKWRWGLE